MPMPLEKSSWIFRTRDSRFNYNPDQGFGGMVLKPWVFAKRQLLHICRRSRQNLELSLHQMFPVMPSALPGGDSFPVSFIIASTADTGTDLELRSNSAQSSGEWNVFLPPGRSTRKSTRPQSQIVFDHDKVASLVSICRKSALTSQPGIGGNLSIVSTLPAAVISHSQIKRIDRLNPATVGKHVTVTGRTTNHIRSARWRRFNTRLWPARSIGCSSSTAVQISGVSGQSLDAR